MNSFNEIKIGILLNYITMVLNVLIGFILTPIIINIIGQSQYGIYHLALAVIGYFNLIDFGFGSAYLRFYYKFIEKSDHRSINGLNGIYFLLYIFFSLIVLILGLIISSNLSIIFDQNLLVSELNTLSLLIFLLSINLTIKFTFNVFVIFIEAKQKFVLKRVLLLLITLLNPIIVIPILLLGFGSIGLVLVTLIFTILVHLLSIFYALKYLNFRFYFGSIKLSLVKEIFFFSSFIFISMIIDLFYWNIGIILLGVFKGPIDVAIFSLAIQFNFYLINFSTSITSILAPKLNSIVAKEYSNSELTNVFIQISRIQFSIVFLILSGFSFFGRTFIKIWVGPDFNQTFIVSLILMVPMLIPLIQNSAIEIRKAKNLHKIPTLFFFFTSILNLFISIPLIIHFGPLGSAIGTASSLIFNTLFTNFYNHFIVKLDIKLFWKELFQISKGVFIPILFGIIVYFNLFSFEDFFIILLIPIYTLIYVFSMYCFGFNKSEKSLFFSIFISKFRKM